MDTEINQAVKTAIDTRVMRWLLAGDVSIQYQLSRDLLGKDRPDLRKRIAEEGWGKRFLAKRKTNGHWGKGFYQPKWISSHYTLLDLKNLGVSPSHELIRESVRLIAETEKSADGGVNPARSRPDSDVCVNGMFLNYACYFGIDPEALNSIVDFVLTQQLDDGGFNCMYNMSGAVHSSLHSSLSIVEGILEYDRNGYRYRLQELREVAKAAEEFILLHKLYISDRTGEIINKSFLRFSYPCRWWFDILRALDYFQEARAKWDERMRPAVDVLLKKQNADGTWNLQAKHAGQLHFEMEKAGKPSRWNTLRALRVLKHFNVPLRSVSLE